MQLTLESAHPLVMELAAVLNGSNLTITTAESCTGGLLAAALTEVVGSSNWFKQSVVTYSNDAKRDMLGVEPHLLEEHGAVSEQVVVAMAAGALRAANADVAVSISGVAGPGGGSAEKPVGTVMIGWALSPAVVKKATVQNALQNGFLVESERFVFSGDRAAVRRSSVHEALRGTLTRIKTYN